MIRQSFFLNRFPNSACREGLVVWWWWWLGEGGGVKCTSGFVVLLHYNEMFHIQCIIKWGRCEVCWLLIASIWHAKCTVNNFSLPLLPSLRKHSVLEGFAWPGKPTDNHKMCLPLKKVDKSRRYTNKPQICPAGMWRQNDVILTARRRHHVASTSIQRHFSVVCPLGGVYKYLWKMVLNYCDRWPYMAVSVFVVLPGT